MTERNKEILRLALVFMNSNPDAIAETFAIDPMYLDKEGRRELDKLGLTESDLDFNGDYMAVPTEEEICQLMKELG